MIIWIARILSGERFRKATEAERRFFSAYFLCFPVTGLLYLWLAISFMNRAGAVSQSLFATAFGFMLVFGANIWAKIVPEKATWVSAAIIWAAILYVVLVGRI